MNQLKRIICLALALCFVLGAVPAVAADNHIKVYVDGANISFAAEPRIIEGRTLVPIRQVAEAVGADVGWEQETKTAIVSRAGKEIRLTIDSLTATVNGEAHTLEVAPALIESNTMLPLRFIMEQLSQEVIWEGETRSIYITEDMSFVTEENDMEAWMLGCGAILARRNNQNPYKIGMSSRSVASAKSARNTLKSSWSCESREDVIATIESMTLYGHNISFLTAYYTGLELQEQGLYDEMLDEATEVDAYMWPIVMEMGEKWGDRGIASWDWFRMMHLAGWGYVAGYLELEEAYALCAPVAELLKANFSSWDEATDNYMDGYAFWGRVDLSRDNNEYVRRYAMYETLKNEQEKNGLLFDPAVWE